MSAENLTVVPSSLHGSTRHSAGHTSWALWAGEALRILTFSRL